MVGRGAGRRLEQHRTTENKRMTLENKIKLEKGDAVKVAASALPGHYTLEVDGRYVAMLNDRGLDLLKRLVNGPINYQPKIKPMKST